MVGNGYESCTIYKLFRKEREKCRAEKRLKTKGELSTSKITAVM